MTFPAVPVLGVDVHCVTEEEVVRYAERCLLEQRRCRIVTVNAEFIMLARTDRAFREAITSADLATPDGAGVVWAARRQGANIERRVGGSDLIWSLSRLAARLDRPVFLLGGAEGVAAAATDTLAREIPGLQIAGTYAGSPSREQEDAIVDLVRASGAGMLFVAYGAPGQDLWIERNLARSGAVIGMGVGGSFDYLAGTARRAPVWMQERGLDWLWRLIRQPWRWRRMLALPRFAWAVVREGRGSRRGERIRNV